MSKYEKYASVAFLLSAIGIFTQLLILPFLMNEANENKSDIQERIKKTQILARTAGIQLTQLKEASDRLKRDVLEYNLEPGPPGDPGIPGEDGEQGDDGLDGPPGMDAYQILLTMQERCVLCPSGPIGLPGPVGDRGITGPQGEKGISGVPGLDGHEGDVGPQGPIGKNGTAGSPGKKGPDGIPAIGGIGKPGPKGLPGAVGGPGQQGLRGKKSYIYGPPGADGKPGINGLDGLPGLPGLRGEKGVPGESGSDIKLCPCPSELTDTEDLDTDPITYTKQPKKEIIASKDCESERQPNSDLQNRLTVEGEVAKAIIEPEEDEGANKVYVLSGKVDEPTQLKPANNIIEEYTESEVVPELTENQEGMKENYDNTEGLWKSGSFSIRPIEEGRKLSSTHQLPTAHSKKPVTADFREQITTTKPSENGNELKFTSQIFQTVTPAAATTTSAVRSSYSVNQRRFIYITKRPRLDDVKV
uniref:Nematode cuticle collagen N-terminal domain-containing protein n=1 Tax=Syphacia muris TaxID=451379 RepID=A0A0N5AS80_9BILA